MRAVDADASTRRCASSNMKVGAFPLRWGQVTSKSHTRLARTLPESEPLIAAPRRRTRSPTGGVFAFGPALDVGERGRDRGEGWGDAAFQATE